MLMWYMAIRRIGACSAAIRGAFDAELTTLLGFLDHADVLTAYTAKEALWKVLVDSRLAEAECVNDVVKALLTPSTSTWRREAGGFRLQLLRQLVKMKDEGESEGDGSGSSEEEEYSYLHVVIKNLAHLGTMVRAVLISVGSEEDTEGLATSAVPHSVQYEALGFLSDLVKRIQGLKIAQHPQVELSGLMIVLMDEVFIPMDYGSQSTFVSCAVLDLLGGFQQLVASWKDQARDNERDSLEALNSKWLERCLIWLMQSSCTSTALRLLNVKESSNMASQAAFIAKSSRYPFLQQWLLYLSRLGVAIIETSLTSIKILNWESYQPLSLAERSWAQQLPSRRQLFAVLAEQDDAMIEVLNGLTRMAILTDDNGDSSNLQWCLTFAAHVTAEFDPDLLFADLVENLGRDHLVLLDLLVSNETQMLEYFMRYLRRLSAQWSTSKQKLQAAERLEGVMSVIIRLRLEIDRLVVANLFPYGAGPLTRRLLVIEQLYEQSEADDAEEV